MLFAGTQADILIQLNICSHIQKCMVATKIWTDQFVVDDYIAALDLDLDHDIGWLLLLLLSGLREVSLTALVLNIFLILILFV